MEVKANTKCFIGDTLRQEGEKFEYDGPENPNVDPVKAEVKARPAAPAPPKEAEIAVDDF
jgi:hypothetical protein